MNHERYGASVHLFWSMMGNKGNAVINCNKKGRFAVKPTGNGQWLFAGDLSQNK